MLSRFNKKCVSESEDCVIFCTPATKGVGVLSDAKAVRLRHMVTIEH